MTCNILLLQGPIGPFFGRFARDLQDQGFTVYKVNFNGGDQLCYRGPNPRSFSGRPEDFPAYLDHILTSLSIDRIYLFGDTRAYHEMARRIARQRNIRIFVFEEGYLRPDYLTLEEYGVNAYSQLPRNPDFYAPWSILPHKKPVKVKFGFTSMAMWAVIYYVASFLMHWRYPHYTHHRPLNVLDEGTKWLLASFHKMHHALTGRLLMRKLSKNPHRFFFVPLQVHCDGQILRHSEYNTVQEFIRDVVGSFARFAPSDSWLVIKHHPMDRPYHNYRRLIRALVAEQGLKGRVFYAHDLHLPKLLTQARGTVVINSTVGLSSLFHGTPVICLSESVYNIPGLTHQDSLESFWTQPSPVDENLYNAFRSYLIKHNQVNGSYYHRISGTKTHSGIIFSSYMWNQHMAEATENASEPAVSNLLSATDVVAAD